MNFNKFHLRRGKNVTLGKMLESHLNAPPRSRTVPAASRGRGDCGRVCMCACEWERWRSACRDEMPEERWAAAVERSLEP